MWDTTTGTTTTEQAIMDLVPHASAVLVGRDAELTELASLLGVPVSGDPLRDDSAAAGHLGRTRSGTRYDDSGNGVPRC
jgi:hypothetical protein